MTQILSRRDQVVGCLLGGAIGDALGAPFEGMWAKDIPAPAHLMAAFGKFDGYPQGQYTDDTQLTLATLESLLSCRAIQPSDIARRIFRLFDAQAVIGPGGACWEAARSFRQHGDWQRAGAPVGSAGNGTAMRTAFLGFCFVDNPAALAQLVGAVARITHHDPRSIAGGIAIAEACRLLVTTPAMPRDAFFHAVATSIQPFDHAFGQAIAALADHAPTSPTVLHAIAWAGLTRPEFEQPIITPFVIPTVLAALWMVATYPTSWTAAVAHTIGLGGDVDTLGAIVGGLMGAKLGVQALPPLLVAQLQSHDQIVQYGEQFAALLNAGFVVNR